MSEPETYDPAQIERLLFQHDNMLHSRVYYLLVAETVFFLAAASVYSHKVLLVGLCILGVVTTLVFTYTNLKLYWRVTWLIEEMRRHSPLYRDYIEMKGVREIEPGWGRITLRLMDWNAPADGAKRPPRWLDTGFLYTWGLLIILVTAWVLLAAVGILFKA